VHAWQATHLTGVHLGGGTARDGALEAPLAPVKCGRDAFEGGSRAECDESGEDGSQRRMGGGEVGSGHKKTAMHAMEFCSAAHQNVSNTSEVVA
jgi:hypothetical protein